MWKVIDTITGETVSFREYIDAEMEAERRWKIHQSHYYGKRYEHLPIYCEIWRDNQKQTITIQAPSKK